MAARLIVVFRPCDTGNAVSGQGSFTMIPKIAITALRGQRSAQCRVRVKDRGGRAGIAGPFYPQERHRQATPACPFTANRSHRASLHLRDVEHLPALIEERLLRIIKTKEPTLPLRSVNLVRFLTGGRMPT
jgi:hypothetical protein